MAFLRDNNNLSIIVTSAGNSDFAKGKTNKIYLPICMNSSKLKASIGSELNVIGFIPYTKIKANTDTSTFERVHEYMTNAASIINKNKKNIIDNINNKIGAGYSVKSIAIRDNDAGAPCVMVEIA